MTRTVRWRTTDIIAPWTGFKIRTIFIKKIFPDGFYVFR